LAGGLAYAFKGQIRLGASLLSARLPIRGEPPTCAYAVSAKEITLQSGKMTSDALSLAGYSDKMLHFPHNKKATRRKLGE
jgi:hypothetical protein